MHETRANHIVKNRECEGATRAENPIFGDSQEELQTFRCALESCAKQFLVTEKIEDGVGQAERAAKLGAAPVKSNALLANFFKVNCDVRGVAAVVELNVNVVFADWFEVASARKFVRPISKARSSRGLPSRKGMRRRTKRSLNLCRPRNSMRRTT